MTTFTLFFSVWVSLSQLTVTNMNSTLSDMKTLDASELFHNLSNFPVNSLPMPGSRFTVPSCEVNQ